MAVNETSITLQWNKPPPVLRGTPQRNIRQYVVTVISIQHGGDPQVVLVPAEAGAFCIITNLQITATYTVKVDVVIYTEGQGEQTYDIGPRPFNVSTASECNFFFKCLVLFLI